MSKIICPCYECIHHSRDLPHCHAGRVKLSEEWLHTVWQGYKQTWTCKMYKPKTEYNEFQQTLRRVLDDKNELED